MNRSRSAIAFLAILAFFAGACGTRRSAVEIQEGALAGVTVTDETVPAAAGTTGGAPGATSGGTSTGSAAPQTTTGAAPATTTGGATAGTTGSAGPATSGTAGGSTPPAGAPPATSGGTGTTGAAAPPAQPGAPLKIGIVGTMSGVGGTQMASTLAVQAWARAVNDRGGLKGHPIEVFVVDDGHDPARFRSALKELVEQRGVIAFVGLLSGFTITQGAVDYLEEAQVPAIGGDRLSILWTQSPMLFPQANAAEEVIRTHMANTARLAGEGATVGWLACQEAQICKDADAMWPAHADEFGLEVAYRASVSVAQPSFTSECLLAQRNGVEWFLLGTDANSIRRIASSCAQQDYFPRYAVLQTSDEMTNEPALEGGYFGSSTFPWITDSTPATAEFHEVIRTYAPDTPLSAHASSGWVAAKLFERVVELADDPTTSAGLLEGLWQIRGEDLGGLTAPLTFTRGQPAKSPRCYFRMELGGAAWITTGDDRPTCY